MWHLELAPLGGGLWTGRTGLQVAGGLGGGLGEVCLPYCNPRILQGRGWLPFWTLKNRGTKRGGCHVGIPESFGEAGAAAVFETLDPSRQRRPPCAASLHETRHHFFLCPPRCFSPSPATPRLLRSSTPLLFTLFSSAPSIPSLLSFPSPAPSPPLSSFTLSYLPSICPLTSFLPSSLPLPPLTPRPSQAAHLRGPTWRSGSAQSSADPGQTSLC